MQKTRFQRFAKKDRDYVAQFVSIRPEWDEPLSTSFERRRKQNVEAVHSRAAAERSASASGRRLCASTLGFQQSEVIQRSLAARLLQDDVRALIHGLQLASRLGYAQNLATVPEDSGGYDCQHVFEILTSLAANDTAVLPAYVERYNKVSKQGHPFTVLLCNGVMMLLRNEVDEHIVQKLYDRKESTHDKAMLLAIAAIAERKSSDLTEHLDTMLKSHRRKTIDDGLLRFFSIHVHGLFHLARLYFEAHDAEAPSPPTNPLWDEAFHTAVLAQPFQLDTDLIAILSPQLAQWAETLPVSVEEERFHAMFEETDNP